MALLSDEVMLMVLPKGNAALDVADAYRSSLIPPYGTVAVSGVDGPHRIAAMRLVPMSAERPISTEDTLELADGLDADSCRRLLGFLLGFCRTAFGLSSDPRFADTCIRLARSCARDAGPARPLAQATQAWMVLGGVSAPSDATFYVLGQTRVRHSRAPAMADWSRPQAAASLHPTDLQLIEPVRQGDLLLALCDTPMLWTVRETSAAVPDVMRETSREPTNAALRTACLRAFTLAGGPAAALLREMQVLVPTTPLRHDDPAAPLGAALEFALPDGDGHLFLRGWIRDPLHLIASVELRTHAGNVTLDPACLHRMRRPDVSNRYGKAAFPSHEPQIGFVARAPDPSGGLALQPTLALRLHSGSIMEVTAPLHQIPAATARDFVLSSLPPASVTPAILDDCLAPAAAALHRQAMAEGRSVDIVQIGTPRLRPAVAILVPLYRNLDFLRFQVAAFAADAECRRAELVYILDSPEQRVELEFLLRGLHLLHDLPFTMVVMPCNMGFAAANNRAAALVHAPVLLLLNSDVVPVRPGWLGLLRAAVSVPGVGAAGPKLLFDDGSIQHAGLFFERDADGMYYNAHYHKGMPRQWPAAQRRRRVPGITGAAMMVRRNLFEAVGGFAEDYIIGDFEDSDLCLRLHGVGAGIAYVPEAELYHFERRSIQLHAGYTGTLVSMYNRRLHHSRWNAVITEVMSRRVHRIAA